ncbi:MAG: biotin--[acetyl-CoA-carboxylase] ligase [Gammaproteobacteria bacterium]|nr:biotin--[acetyl-CoA-carboxylase] ligase [Gammaproteobacteria bacterium]
MDPLLEILSDGDFHSGAAIGRQLGISRAAIWKRMQFLEQRTGLSLERSAGKGYRLSGIELFDLVKLQQACGSGARIAFYETVDSTNSEAMRQIKSRRMIDVVIAESQTAGKGRRGRSWMSPFASNLYMSLIWPVVGSVRQLEGLSLVVGLAVARALREAGLDAGVKWPNDVQVGGKKISGILLELTGDPADQSFVVIGIGVNVNSSNLGEEIGQPWTSIALEKGGHYSRLALLESLYGHLQDMLALHEQQGFSAFRDEWKASELWLGQRVCLSMGDRVVSGRYAGVNERGEVGIQDGEAITFYSGGELSLRLADDC